MTARQRRLGAIRSALCAGDGAAVATLEAETESQEAVTVPLPAALAALLPEDAQELVVRAALPGDETTMSLVTHYGFAMQSDPSEPFEFPSAEGDDRSRIEKDSTWGAFAGDRAVSQLLAHRWALGSGCKVAAVSGVSTLPEYRRLGLLRTMMAMLFKDMRRQGQPLAALGATQAAIYQRYGYGEAVRDVRSYSIDTVDVNFVDGDAGSCTVIRREITDDLTDTVLRPLYEEFIEGRACAFGFDDTEVFSRASNRLSLPAETLAMFGVARPNSIAVATDANGDARGYCIYNIGERNEGMTSFEAGGHPTRFQKLDVKELVYADTDAYRSIFSFLSRHDLVGEINVGRVPSDDPAPSIFLEPRLLRTKTIEGSWWRIVDVVGTLESRKYSLDGLATGSDTLTIDVKDDERLAPWNIGTWTLQVSGSDDSASVSKAPAGTVAEVSVGIGELASLWSGAVTARQLSGYGLLTAVDALALAKADHLFATPRAPFCFDGW